MTYILTPEQADIAMQRALQEANACLEQGEVPIGCVIMAGDKIWVACGNRRESLQNPLAHAELLALTAMSEIRHNWRLEDCAMIVTVEPCFMCLGALMQARVGSLYFGAPDPKRDEHSFFPSLQGRHELKAYHHTLKVSGGVRETECRKAMQSFFKKRRLVHKID
jgi:tRNA(adenine34) deaminase